MLSRRRLAVLVVGLASASTGAAQSRVDSMEVAVLRIALRNRGADKNAVVGATTDTSVVCGLISRNRERGACLPDSLRADFAPAIHDFVRRNASGERIPDSALRLLGFAVYDSDHARPNGTCEGPIYYFFTRVGFDADFRHAVVTLETSRGRGPYPGCGWASGRTMLLRRSPNNEWVFVAAVGGWIT